MNVETLRTDRLGKLAVARRLLLRAESARRDFTPREKREWDLVWAEIYTLYDQINALELGPEPTVMDGIRANPDLAWRLAIHESAHAVFEYIQGRGIAEVSLTFESGRLAGYCIPRRYGTDPVALMAGGAGEHLLLGGESRLWGGDLSRVDALYAQEHLQAEPRRADDLARAVEALRPHVDAIETLAGLLLKRGTVRGSDAEQLLGDVLPFEVVQEAGRAEARNGWHR